jgi:hypothetical protein
VAFTGPDWVRETINNFNEVICAGFCVDDGSSIRLNFLSWWSLLPRPLGSTNVNVQCLLVGRPGLDPGTLRVFPERPGTSIIIQICWPDKVQCPPTSTDVLSRLTSWLDSWLDPGSFQGQVTIRFRGVDGEMFNLRLGEEWKISEDSLGSFPGTTHFASLFALPIFVRIKGCFRLAIVACLALDGPRNT